MTTSSSGWDRKRRQPFSDVTCQLNFPDILTIASAPPAAFQDAIRMEYPLFQLASDRRSYSFSTADRQSEVILTQGSVGLVTKSYLDWPTYRHQMQAVATALEQVYHPPFFARVGLRYRSLLRPSQYGIAAPNWMELINPKVLGPFSIPEVQGELQGSQHQVVMTLGKGPDRFRLTHGFVMVTDANLKEKPGEISYLLDQDYFTLQQCSRTEALIRLDRFECEAERFFNVCVTERWHRALPLQAA